MNKFILSVLVLLSSAGPVGAQQSPDALIVDIIAAVNNDDAAALRELTHPQSIVYLDKTKPGDLDARYQRTINLTVPESRVLKVKPLSDNSKYDVEKHAVRYIDSWYELPVGTKMTVTLLWVSESGAHTSLHYFIAEVDGRWFIAWPLGL